jgi:hypothetical protein
MLIDTAPEHGPLGGEIEDKIAHAFANSNAKTTHCNACLIFQISELNEITEEKLDSVNCAVEGG